METTPIPEAAPTPEPTTDPTLTGQIAKGDDVGRPVIRAIGIAIMLLITTATFIYLILITCGQVQPGNRLGSGEIAIGAIACFFIILLTNPEIFDRLSLVKLPGGVELKLNRLERKQQEQQTYLHVFFAILSNLLSFPEKYHLRSLLRGKEPYTGCQPLRDELFRLMRFGLIEEVEGQKIGDFLDGKSDYLSNYVRLTENGKRFIIELDRIERH